MKMDPDKADILVHNSGVPLEILSEQSILTPYELDSETISQDPPPLESLSKTYSTAKVEPPIENVVIDDKSETKEVPKKTFAEHVEEDSAEFTQRTLYGALMRMDVWMYILVLIILIVLTFMLYVNLFNSNFFQKLNYPRWAPSGNTLMIIFAIVFILSLLGLWLVSSRPQFVFFISLLSMNIFILLLFMLFTWFAGVILVGSIFIFLGIIFSIFVVVAFFQYNPWAGALQIPYTIFLCLLFVISIQLSQDND